MQCQLEHELDSRTKELEAARGAVIIVEEAATTRAAEHTAALSTKDAELDSRTKELWTVTIIKYIFCKTRYEQ